MVKIIAIANQKGGVGKTTTSVNLGACLAALGKKTLLLDLDPQGNASSAVGLERKDYIDGNIYHALIGQLPIESAVYKTILPNLFICPADNNLIGAEIELVSVFARESKLKSALMDIHDEYEYLIIDCPPSLGILTVNALNCATHYIVPLQTEYFAMEGLSQLINTVKMIKSSLNAEIELLGILLTMFDRRNKLHKQVSAEIKGHFEQKVFDSCVPRNVKLSECPSFGRPVILYDANSKGSTAYFALAKEVIERFAKQEQEQVEDKKVSTLESSLPELPTDLNH